MLKLLLFLIMVSNISWAKSSRTRVFTDQEALINKILGTMPSRSSGWAFKDLSPDHMVIDINISDYPKDLVLSSYNQLVNDGYPVLFKQGTLTFDWKNYYCKNYETNLELRYLSLVDFIVSDTRSDSFERIYDDKCLIKKLSLQQRKELLGPEYFDYGKYIIGGSWVSLEHKFQKREISFKQIEKIGQDIKVITDKYCAANFKSTTSRVIASIIPLSEEHLILKNQTSPELNYSYKRICEKH